MNVKHTVTHGYHNLVRPEIASLIPTSAHTILDIGCGTGALGKAIKARQKCVYHGIEINKKAAKIARNNLDCAYEHDCESLNYNMLNYDYDTIIMADILEHLRDPWTTLKKAATTLKESGTIIASIPNIAHPGIIHDLQRDLFRYTPAGILDRTHLRFFTITSIFQMFAQANLKISQFLSSPTPENPVQFLITAQKATCYGKENTASIILPCSTQYKLLQGTIASIRAHTPDNVRIMAVNNAMPPEGTKWLEQQNDILEIRCTKNTGFTTAINLGLEISDTPYIVIGNDDILVTDGWLDRLIVRAEANPKIGIVGPISNRVSGPQQDPNAKYQNEKELTDYASKVTKENWTQQIPFHRIIFFCTLIKKKVIDTVGHLDENFSPGCFEDDDFCLRTVEAGFKCIIDRSTFVHHFGTQTQNKNENEYKERLKRNHAYFLRKWGTKLERLLKLGSQ